jgi:hypothetical protein
MANQSVREKDVQIIPVPLFPHFNFSCLCKEIFFKYVFRGIRRPIMTFAGCLYLNPESLL